MTFRSPGRRARLITVSLVVATAVASGCGPKVPDYQSIWTTSSPTTTNADDGPVPISQYLESVGVTGDTIAPDKLTDLTVTMPSPPGWQPYQNTNLAPGTRVIAKGETYPTAMLIVLKLNGDFDVAEAISHGYVDAEKSQNFKRLNASTANWRNFPSSMIEGSYDLNGARMQSYNRVVIATGKPQPPKPGQPPAPPQRYLVQLTITAYAEKAQADGPDIEAIIKGFNVAPK